MERGIYHLRPAQPIGNKGTCLPDIFIAVVDTSAHQEFTFQDIDGFVFSAVVREEDEDGIRVFTVGFEGFDDAASLQIEVFDHSGIDGYFLGQRTLEIGDCRDLPDGIVGGSRHLFEQRCPRRIALVVPVRHPFIALTQCHRLWDDAEFLQPGQAVTPDAVPPFLEVKVDQILADILFWELAGFMGQGDRIVDEERFFAARGCQTFLDQFNRPVGLGAGAKIIEWHAIAADDLVIIDKVRAPTRSTFAGSPVVATALEHTERVIEALVDRPCPARVDALAVDFAFCAQVPLAHMIGIVSGIAQQRGHGHYMLVEVASVAGQPILCCVRVSGDCALHDAQSIDMILDTGQNLRTAGRTGRLGVVIGELHTLGRKRVDHWSRRFTAERPEIRISRVIGDQQHDVRAWCPCCWCFLLRIDILGIGQQQRDQRDGEKEFPPSVPCMDRPRGCIVEDLLGRRLFFKCHMCSPGKTERNTTEL